MALRTLCPSTSSPVIFFLSRDYFLEAGSHKDDCGNAINVSTPRNLSAGLGSQFGGAGDGAGENLDLRGTCTEAGQVPSQQAVGLLVSGVKVDPEALAPHSSLSPSKAELLPSPLPRLCCPMSWAFSGPLCLSYHDTGGIPGHSQDHPWGTCKLPPVSSI